NFSTLTVDKPANGYTLVASISGANVTSNSFNITVGAAAKWVFTSTPTLVGAGSPVAFNLAAVDLGGNTVTTASPVTVTLAITSAALGAVKTVSTAGGLPTLLTLTTTPRGVATDGVSVFWLELGTTPTSGSGAIKKIPIGGGGVTSLATGLTINTSRAGSQRV